MTSSALDETDELQDAYWLSTLKEFALGVAHLFQQLESAEKQSQLKSLPSLTALERSFASTRASAFSRERTSKVAHVLKSVTEGFWEWIQDHAKPCCAQQVRCSTPLTPMIELIFQNVTASIFEVLSLAQDLCDLAQLPIMDEAVLSVYILSGRTMLAKAGKHEGILLQLLQKLNDGLSQFSDARTLSSGISMEPLWNKFRPPTPSTFEQLSIYLRMEQLADRFDNLVWRTQVPVEQLSGIRTSIAGALHELRSQTLLSPKTTDVSS